MTGPVRLALVGLGYWGPHFARIANEHSDIELAWCCDRSEAALELPRRRYPHVGRTTDFDEVLGDASVDAVVIATPTATHADLAVAALSAGKHVLVEKPLAASSEEIDRIEAARGDRVVMVGHTFVYNSGVGAMRDLVASGELGRIQYVDSVRAALGPIRHDVNALWDLGAHDVSIFLDVLPGTPQVVTAIAQDYLREGHPDVVYFAVRFDDGVLAHSHVSWLDPYKVRRITVVGEDRMVVFDDVAPDERVKILERGASYEAPAEEARGQGFGEYRAVRPRGDDHDPEAAEPRAADDAARGVPRRDPRRPRAVLGDRAGARRRARARGGPALAGERRRPGGARQRADRYAVATPSTYHCPTRNSVERPRVTRSSPRDRLQLRMRDPLDGPAGALHRLDDVAPREPAQVRPVAVAPLGVAERALEDQVLHQRDVARVRQRHLQPRARRRDAVEVGHHAIGVDEVLQHIEAQDRVEGAVELLERVLDRRRDDVVVVRPRELGLVRDHLDAGQTRGAGASQACRHAA